MRVRFWLVLVCAALVAAGCTKPPKPKIDNVYRGLTEDLPRLDPGILAGRRIVVDPGHGGHYAGTRGQNGLEESMVNLGVSLYLWGLLHEAGAEVYLTRSAEKDFLTDADTTVAADLQIRVEMVDSLQPDILVSIHHNAHAQRDPDKNATETYYKLGDPASRDLAFSVHRHLMRNLGIDNGEVRPGNYYMLRNVDIPAILGEGSYLTNTSVEKNLRLSEKQRLEAEAYFLGVLEYFSRGTPRLEQLAPEAGDSILISVPYLAFSVSDIGGVGVDPAGIDMKINGAPVDASLDPAGTTVGYRLPWDTPNGSYDVTLRTRNLLGNSSQIHGYRFELNHAPRHAIFLCEPDPIPEAGGTLQIRARILDNRGIAIADGNIVDVSASVREEPNGEWTALEFEDGNEATKASVHRGMIEFAVGIPAGTSALKLIAGGFEHTIDRTSAESTGFRAFTLVDKNDQSNIRRAVFISGNVPIVEGSETNTYLVPESALGTGDMRIAAPGYIPVELTGEIPDTLALVPWFDGKLIGARFFINPEGGFGSEFGIGNLGLSGPHVNLHVARYLAEYLQAAGAETRLARATEETLSDRDIVTLTNQFRANRYVEIRHRSEPSDTGRSVTTYFFPGSQRGHALATDVGDALSKSLVLSPAFPLETVTYPLQQTACPAIIVEPPSLADLDEELRLSEPWYQRLQAYGIFCGILANFGVDDTASLRVVVEAELPQSAATAAANWLVTIDNTWRLLLSNEGVVQFDLLPPGDHRVVLQRGGQLVGPYEISIQPGENGRLDVTVPRKR